jgi:multimeric flavodoxin WrbA
MNILIINGSLRKEGLISQMLSIIREEAEKRGDTMEMVYINDLTMKPCTGCMACRTKEECVLAKDDAAGR